MAIEYVDEVPKRTPRNVGRPRKSYLDKEIEEFLAGDGDVARLVIEGHKTVNVYNMLNVYMKRRPEMRAKVAYTKRGNDIYLMRIKSV